MAQFITEHFDPNLNLLPNDGPMRQKWWKLWPKKLQNCCCACNACFLPLRRAVSTKKRRYDEDGYKLDLTYLTPRIIVCGFPATGVEHLYRNPRNELRRFLDERHQGRYMVFNFCNEPGRGYAAETFHGA